MHIVSPTPSPCLTLPDYLDPADTANTRFYRSTERATDLNITPVSALFFHKIKGKSKGSVP
jgi:hypothetical protein